MARNHIVLVGAMGSGKTAVGTRLAAALGRPFVDSDDQIEAAYGATGRELAARMGVAWLHDAEAAAFSDAIESPHPAVVAAAASIADRDELVAVLESTELLVVLLETEAQVLADRTKPDDHRRPVDWGDMASQIERRRARLAAVTDVAISTTAVDIESVVAEVLGVCENRP